MHYELPTEENIEAIRAELAQTIRERDEPIIRRNLIDAYADSGTGYVPGTLRETVARKIEGRVESVVKRATEVSWNTIRRRVFERDQGICHVCGRSIERDEYECGHIVDRVAGGSDRPSNLVTMCVACNQMKPVHDSRADYIAWLESGDWRAGLLGW